MLRQLIRSQGPVLYPRLTLHVNGTTVQLYFNRAAVNSMGFEDKQAFTLWWDDEANTLLLKSYKGEEVAGIIRVCQGGVSAGGGMIRLAGALSGSGLEAIKSGPLEYTVNPDGDIIIDPCGLIVEIERRE